MNYQELKLNTLSTVLDRHSTLHLSKQLGFSFNKVQRWLTGSKQCRWDEFWNLCLQLELPIVPALQSVFLFDLAAANPKRSEAKTFISYLRQLHDHQPITFLAKKINVHASVLKRYFRGDTSPDLDVVFALMDLNENALASFLTQLLGSNKVQKFKAVEKNAEQKKIETLWPASIAIEASLDLQSYKNLIQHSDDFIAEITGVSQNDVHSIIDELKKHGKISQAEQKFLRVHSENQKASINDEDNTAAVNYWTNQALLRFIPENTKPILKGDGSNFAAYHVVATSKAASRKITELLIRTQNEIRDLLAKDSEAPTDVRVILTHHFSIQDRLPSP